MTTARQGTAYGKREIASPRFAGLAMTSARQGTEGREFHARKHEPQMAGKILRKDLAGIFDILPLILKGSTCSAA